MNQSKTAIKSHHENKATGLYRKQEDQVIDILLKKDKPMTSRALMDEMRKTKWVELSSAHRTVNTLQKVDILTVFDKTKCPKTGKTVRQYWFTNEYIKQLK